MSMFTKFPRDPKNDHLLPHYLTVYRNLLKVRTANKHFLAGEYNFELKNLSQILIITITIRTRRGPIRGPWSEATEIEGKVLEGDPLKRELF